MIWLLPFLLLLCSCQPGLDQQPKVKDNSLLSLRERPTDTVAVEEAPAEKPPLTIANLKRGQELYEIHCSVCHGLSGEGNGIAVDRGFPAPLAFALDAKMPLEEIESTIASGRGKMFGVSNKLHREERWLVAYYVRALQVRERLSAMRESK